MTLYAICFLLSSFFAYDSFKNKYYEFSIWFMAVALLCLIEIIKG